MSGAIATVILREPFTASHTGSVSRLLRDIATDVVETRKGRHWEFTDAGSRASLTVFQTCDRADFHDDLLDAGLATDDAPEIVVIDYPLKRDRESCERLAPLVADLLVGLNRGVGDG